MKAPNVKETIIAALESGMVLTNGSANELTRSTEGGRTIRHLRSEGYPISERWRENKLRSGRVKEFFYTNDTLKRIKEAKAAEAVGLFG